MRSYISCLLLLMFASIVRAGSKDPADYPLRIHIFRRAETTFYRNRVAEETKGEGRGNLFENGSVRGVDFEFACSEKLKTSSGFETFPAKWKKPQEELIVMQPEFGKQDHYSTCKLKVQLKDFAYYSHNGVLSSEPVAAYKKWMVEHDYDPEHGKNTPAPANPQGDVGSVPIRPRGAQ